MKLLAKPDLERLARNRRNAAADPAYDPAPVVKLFTPDAGASCLLAWTEPGDPDLAFGLCDLGLGSPELGSVRLSEILEVRGQRGATCRAGPALRANGTIGAHADAARRAGRVVDRL